MPQEQTQASVSAEAELAQTLATYSPEAIAGLIQQMSQQVEKLHEEVTTRDGRIQYMDGQIITLVQQIQKRDGMLGQAVEEAQELRTRIQQLEEANQALCDLNGKLMQRAKTTAADSNAETMVRPKNAVEALASLSDILEPVRSF